jgi:tetratricopeptide (TPR) repeat protein
VLQKLGKTNLLLKHYYDVIEYYNMAVKLEPNKPEYYSSLGISYYALKDTINAYASFSKCIELNNKSAISYYYLGKIHDDMMNYEEAIKNFDKAIELGSSELSDGALRRGRGIVFVKTKKL